jgi:hypothetical protein
MGEMRRRKSGRQVENFLGQGNVSSVGGRAFLSKGARQLTERCGGGLCGLGQMCGAGEAEKARRGCLPKKTSCGYVGRRMTDDGMHSFLDWRLNEGSPL